MHRPTLSVLILLALTLAPGLGFAQPDADRAAARSLGLEGQAALEHSNYPLALDRFSRADKLYRAHTLILGLARAQVGLGKLVAAHETYARLAREPLPPNPSPTLKKAQEDGAVEQAALKSRLPVVVVSVTGPTDATIALDEEPFSPALLGVKRPIDPGTHRISATAAGWLPSERTFEVTEGATIPITLALKKDSSPRAEPPSAAAGDRPAVTGDPGARSDSSRTLGYISLGIGGVGLVAGGVLGVLAIGKKSDLDSACTDGICPRSSQPTYNTYKRDALVSTLGFSLGVVGAGLGIALLLRAPSNVGTAHLIVGPGSVAIGKTFLRFLHERGPSP
jgi:hypothetical protein